MSYKYRVLADAPLGYWRLNEYVLSTYDDADILYDEPGYEYDQVLSDRLYDETLNANQGFVSGGSSAIFTDVLPLTTQSNVVTDQAGCRVTDNAVLKIRNRPNKYRMFYQGTENLSFGIEFWLSLDNAPALAHNLITIYSGGVNSARIYALNDKIYFEITGTSGTYTCFKQVVKWDSQLHIFAYYTGRGINISVNAMPGDGVVMPQSFFFSLDNADSMNVDYQIGPAASGDHFIISDLAFYDYVLSTNVMKGHMVWSANDSKPQNYVKETSGYFFDIKDSENMFDFKKEFAKESDYQEGTFVNLQADGNGLSIPRTSIGTQISGTWTYQIPASSFAQIEGVRVSWDSGSTDNSIISTSNYVAVDLSYDNGGTWKTVSNGYPAVQFADSSLVVYPNILIRVTISTSDSSMFNQPRIDNLIIAVYKDLAIYSDMGAFALMPRQGSYTGDTYSIRNNMFNVMARSKNFGIKLDYVDGKNSVAVIQPQPQSEGYRTIDFWFRYDDLSPSYHQYILENTQRSAYIYFLANGNEVYQDGFDAVYVNGIDISLANKKLIQGEIYHFVCVYQEKLNSPIYLGGDASLTQYSLGTFGFLSLYPNAFTQGDAQSRYLSFLTSNTGTTGLGVNYMGSLAELKSTSTDFNGGSPILSYNSRNV